MLKAIPTQERTKTVLTAPPETLTTKITVSDNTSKPVLARLNRWTMRRVELLDHATRRSGGGPYLDRKEATTFLERFEKLLENFAEEEHSRTNTTKKTHSYCSM